jgi:2-aminoadipate transaminase
MKIGIDRGAPVSLYRQISQSIRTQILQGLLPDGYRLPPERRLAETLGVNRTTILNAYRELKAEGLIGGHVGRGTTVVGRRPEPATGAPVPQIRWSDLLRPTASGPVEIRDLMAHSEARDVILLSAGFPAPDLTPVELVRGETEAVFAERGAGALVYAPTEGVSTLRRALAALMGDRGVDCRPDDVLVTSGSQQAIDLVTRVLVEPGDVVVVEEPTYFGALRVFGAAQARVLGVPIDAQGMRTDLLEHVLRRYQPKLIYTMPSFQNPSGALMSGERRLQLIELAERFQVPLVEDDVYADLALEGAAPPSLKALDRHGFVVHVSSFSKLLCPGLRVGWAVVPRPLLRRLARAKETADLQTGTLGQMLVERLLRSGAYANHVQRVRESYRARRDAMQESLHEHARDWASWSLPRGGSYFWCRLAQPMPVDALLARAAERRVTFLPGTLCFAQEPAGGYLRLSFSYAKPGEIREGVARLSRAVHDARESSAVTAAAETSPPLV